MQIFVPFSHWSHPVFFVDVRFGDPILHVKNHIYMERVLISILYKHIRIKLENKDYHFLDVCHTKRLEGGCSFFLATLMTHYWDVVAYEDQICIDLFFWEIFDICFHLDVEKYSRITYIMKICFAYF